MPSKKSTGKAARQAERKRLHNRAVKSSSKTRIAVAKKEIDAQSSSAPEKAREAVSSIDKAANKGIFHRNKAARLKSRLTKKMNVLTASITKQSQGNGG
ncbi:MAG: 30S ribosomal protein S20 [Chloroflexota bacterium]|nr:30S ribosomal protein S20 [Chloroflexota bacterium]